MSYRVIAKVRHRKLSAIGLYTVLSLRHFRLARWCSLSLREAGAEGSGAAHLDRQTDPHPPPGWCSGC